MKRFIDSAGKFEIKIPEHWRYSLKNKKVHTFQDYETGIHDAFQISINSANDQASKNRFVALTKKLIPSTIAGVTFHSFPDKVSDQFTVKTWLRLIDDNVAVFSLTYSVNQDKNFKKRLELVHKVISSFRLIEGEKSESELNSYRFETFLEGVAATAYMVHKAIEHKSFIEATCLFATQIDALLRTGVILQKQLTNKNTEIETEWIYQGLDDKKKSEKDVYNKALELEIVDKEIFDDLYKLYEDRNRVIHRFVISEITLAEVETIAFQYYLMLQKINKAVYTIESKQIESDIGMTKQGSYSKNIDPIKFIKGKIGKIGYFDDKK